MSQSYRHLSIVGEIMAAVTDTIETTLESFSQLVRTHHRELLVYAHSLTKENHAYRDIVQDAFIAAWKNIERFDVTRDFGSWMRGIVRNKWREWLRKNQREVSIEDDTLEAIEGEMRAWENLRQDGGPTVFIHLEKCLGKLPETMAKAIKATYHDGLSTEEAAAALKINGATLRKRLQRARTALRECIQGII